MIDPTIVLLANATVEKRLAQELAKVYAAEKIVGPKGESGKDGSDGLKGDRGDKGDKGDIGKTGARGPRGKDGDDGKDGRNGRDGKDGVAKVGPKGEPGKDGKGISFITITPEGSVVVQFTDGTAQNIGQAQVNNISYNSGGGGILPDHYVINAVSVDGSKLIISCNHGKRFEVTLPSGGGGSSVWGAITGNLSDQTDLQTALATKSDVGHTHANVTTSVDGFMSAADKTKLDSIASGATAYTDELAQDAVGAMVDASLTYVDGTPLLQRAALIGAITASAGSNTTSLGSFTKAQLDTAVSDADMAILTDNTFTGLQTIPRLNLGLQSIATAAGTTTLTSSSVYHTIFTGATTQTVVLPNATTLANGHRFKLSNNSTGAVTVQTNGGATFWIIAGATTDLDLVLSDNSTAAGTWEKDYRVGTSASGKSSTFNNSLTFSGTDGTAFTLPSTSGTLALAVGTVTAAPGSDQSNWSPSGFASGTGYIKAQPTTNSFITGIVAGSTDQEVTLFNDSAFVICLECESTASTAANRFAKVPDVPWVLPQQSVTLRYSATLSRWVVLWQSFPIMEVSKTGQLLLPATGTSINVIGLGSQVSTATLSTVAPSASPTDDFQEYGYTQGTNSTAAGTTSIRSGQAMHMRGATAGRQGFVYYGRVRFTALGATSGAVRAGMMSTTAVSTTLNAALTNCLLLGADTSMTTLRIFRGDAAAGTPIDLGANFPVPSATAAYDVLFYAPPNASYVRYMVRRLDTRFVAEGSLTTNIPVNTQVLSQRVEAMVGATAVANTWQAAFSLVVGL